MERRRLGDSDLEVSVVGVGCNNFGSAMDEAQTKTVVDAALDAGVTFFDTADVYGDTRSEVFLGKALGKRRREAVIGTKFGMPHGKDGLTGGGSRRWITQAVEDSLRRLGTDYIDLYQLHQWDPQTPLEETLGALEELAASGKVRQIGCSNFMGWQLAEGHRAAGQGHRFVSVQNNYSLLDRTAASEVLPACEHFGIGFLPYFPLAMGMLTGKYRRSEPPAAGTRLASWGAMGRRVMSQSNFDKVERLTRWAEVRGHTILDLAFAWLLAQPAIPSVTAGATSVRQLQANASAAQWRLSAEEMAEIELLLTPLEGVAARPPARSEAEAPIRLERMGDVRIITFNRPAKRNAANFALQEMLLECVKEVAADSEARALVITGAGPTFCAGGDLGDLQAAAEGRLANQDVFQRVHNDTVRLMLELPIPTIAAVRGAAAGMGAVYVALCDLVVMADDAMMWDPHTESGLPGNLALQVIWPWLTSQGVAKELLFTGRRVDAREALSIGLANRICAAGEERTIALEMAQALAAMPKSGIASTKRGFNRDLIQSFERAWAAA